MWPCAIGISGSDGDSSDEDDDWLTDCASHACELNDRTHKDRFILFSSTYHNCQNWISLFEFYLIQPNSLTELSIWVYCVNCTSGKTFVATFGTKFCIREYFHHNNL